MRTYSAVDRSFPATMGWVAIGTAVLMASFGSLTQKGEWVLPSVSIDRRLPSLIDTEFANFPAFSFDIAAVGRTRVPGLCNDFHVSFLNSTCSKIHKKHAARRTHRVATFVKGHPDLNDR